MTWEHEDLMRWRSRAEQAEDDNARLRVALEARRMELVAELTDARQAASAYEWHRGCAMAVSAAEQKLAAFDAVLAGTPEEQS